jgi:Uncharacterized protein conserved in bacteria
MRWRKFNGETISLPIKQAVEDAIKREHAIGNKLKVCIGTDSQVKGIDTEFATVIVFLRERSGGFMFIHNERTTQKFSIKERMLVEVAKSIEIAYELCDLFTQYEVDMEVHADINTTPVLKATRHCGKPWATYSAWALPLKPSQKPLPAAAVPTKW